MKDEPQNETTRLDDIRTEANRLVNLHGLDIAQTLAESQSDALDQTERRRRFYMAVAWEINALRCRRIQARLEKIYASIAREEATR